MTTDFNAIAIEHLALTDEMKPSVHRTCRSGRVTFPNSIATHYTNQIFYYDKDFMQHRWTTHPTSPATRSSPITPTTRGHSTASWTIAVD